MADFDHDNDVDFDDFTLFAQAWRDVDIMRDIGPTTGSPPDLDPAFDGVLDFEDLATFVVMWHWSHDHGPSAAPVAVSGGGAAGTLSYRTEPNALVWHRETLHILPTQSTDLLAAKLTLHYDPRQMSISPSRRYEADDQGFSLTQHDERAGVLEIQTVWFADRSPHSPLAFVEIDSRGRPNAEMQVAFDLRDSENHARRGQETLRIQFETPPVSTAVLQNFPNPFNPETWIPFDLAEPADITVRIYSVAGELVRTLQVGRQPAGRYRSRQRSVYWDGSNQLGEAVGSGVYVYELNAGGRRETGRMVIQE